MLESLRSFAAGQVDPNVIGVPRVELTQNVVGNVVSTVFVVVGALAVFFLLVGAARYVTANGEQAKIAQAKNTILYSIIGIIISALGFTIVQFVVGRLTGTLT
ncbi:MAG TPA: hypothetical protein VJM32_06845 [Candidatus Saccharimonadales bacterium]|nr:hypothetical protein [Candidatus Saccharimonadales bacterium]